MFIVNKKGVTTKKIEIKLTLTLLTREFFGICNIKKKKLSGNETKNIFNLFSTNFWKTNSGFTGSIKRHVQGKPVYQ